MCLCQKLSVSLWVVVAGVGVAGTRQQSLRSGGGSLHQQRSHGPRTGLPGGPQRQEHGDRVEEGRVYLSFRI